MRLLSLELEDVCQHARLDVQFAPGINGILGNNGSGKSNAIKSILFALTGDFDNHGAKEDNLRQLAPLGAKGRVVLWFEHAGVSYRVERAITAPTATLDADGVRIATGATAVNKAIIEKIGVPVDVVRRHAFVSQKTISQFLSETPTVRAASYARIFGTEGIANLQALADKALKADMPPPPDPRIPEVEADLKAAVAQARVLKNRLFRLRRSTPSPAAVSAASARIALAQAAELAREKVAELRARAGGLDGELTLARVTLERYDAERVAAAAAGSVVAARSLWRAHDQAVLDARRRATRLAALTQQLAAMPEPGASPDREGAERQRLRDQIAYYEAEEANCAKQSRQVSQLLEGSDRAACPVCGTEGVDLSSHLGWLEAGAGDARQNLGHLRKALTDLEAAQATWQAADRDYRKLADEADALAAQVGDDVANPPRLPEVPRPDDGPTPQPPPSDQVYRMAQADVARLTSALALAQSRLDEALADAAADPGDVIDDAILLAYSKASAVKLAAAQAESESVRRTIATLGARLAALRAVEAALGPIRAWCEVLAPVKAAFHPTALPRAVAEQNQALMVGRINEVLGQFGVDWRVQQAPELAFTAVFEDGRVQPDRRLSPGQLTTLALATRVAIHTLFASDLGFLAMDEPTDGLSQRNIPHVAAAIAQLRQVAEAGALQCVVITHEPQLGALLDHVIDLDRAI